jgi:hypothetical protein
MKVVCVLGVSAVKLLPIRVRPFAARENLP